MNWILLIVRMLTAAKIGNTSTTMRFIRRSKRHSFLKPTPWLLAIKIAMETSIQLVCDLSFPLYSTFNRFLSQVHPFLFQIPLDFPFLVEPHHRQQVRSRQLMDAHGYRWIRPKPCTYICPEGFQSIVPYRSCFSMTTEFTTVTYLVPNSYTYCAPADYHCCSSYVMLNNNCVRKCRIGSNLSERWRRCSSSQMSPPWLVWNIWFNLVWLEVLERNREREHADIPINTSCSVNDDHTDAIVFFLCNKTRKGLFAIACNRIMQKKYAKHKKTKT